MQKLDYRLSLSSCFPDRMAEIFHCAERCEGLLTIFGVHMKSMSASDRSYANMCLPGAKLSFQQITITVNVFANTGYKQVCIKLYYVVSCL